jgi:hypothetical protein
MNNCINDRKYTVIETKCNQIGWKMDFYCLYSNQSIKGVCVLVCMYEGREIEGSGICIMGLA